MSKCTVPYAALCAVLACSATGHCEQWKFDFGTPKSVTRKGFVKVTRKDAFSPEKGYGFESTEGLLDGDRGGWKKEKPKNARRARVYGAQRSTSYTTCDFVEGTQDNAFKAVVPDGDYTVWLVASDAYWAPPYFDVWANGERRAEVRVPRRRFVYMEPFQARAENRELRIELKGVHGWLANALVIGRPGKELDRTVADLDRDIFFATADDLASWTEDKHVSPNAPPKLTPQEKARGYVTFVRDYSTQVFPSSVPTRREIAQPLTAFAAHGEFEPASFCIYPGRDLGPVDVELSDFVSADGSTISRDRIRVGIVRCWPQRKGGSRGPSGRYMVVPEMMDPASGRRSEVQSGQVKQWWLTVHVPEGAAPGRYRMELTIRPQRAPAQTLEWRLLVLPIKLVRPKDRHWGTWLDAFPPLGGLNGPARRGRNTPLERARISRAEMADFREHGLDTAIISANSIKVTDNPDGTFSYELARLPEQMEYLKALDSSCSVTLLLEYLCRRIEYRYADEPKDKHVAGTFSAKARAAIVGLVRFLSEEAKRRGWPRIYYYPIDEPGNSKTENRYIFAKHVLDMVHQVKGCKTACTCTSRCIQRLGDRIDLRIYAYGHYDRRVALRDAKRGFPFWYYSNGIFYGESPLSSRGRTGFEFLRSCADTATAWGFVATAANPHNDFDGGHEDWNVMFPGVGRPTPTIYWELCREGVDDCRYVATLQEQARLARQAGRQADADRAETVLAPLLDPDATPIANPEAYGRCRWALAREILRLTGSGLVEQLSFTPVAAASRRAAAYEPNVIANPSFEDGPKEHGLPGWPYPFTDPFTTAEKGPRGAIVVTDEAAHTGKYSLKWDFDKVKHEGGSSWGGHRWLIINVQIAKEPAKKLAGKRVKVGMWVRVTRGTLAPGFRLRQFRKGKYVDGIPYNGGISDPTVWNHFEAEGLLQHGIDNLDIHTPVRIPKDPEVCAGSCFYIDDVYVQAYRPDPVAIAIPLDEYRTGEEIPWRVDTFEEGQRVTVSVVRDGETVRTRGVAAQGRSVTGSIPTAGLAPGLYTIRASLQPKAGGKSEQGWQQVIVAPDPFRWE